MELTLNQFLAFERVHDIACSAWRVEVSLALYGAGTNRTATRPQDARSEGRAIREAWENVEKAEAQANNY